MSTGFDKVKAFHSDKCEQCKTCSKAQVGYIREGETLWFDCKCYSYLAGHCCDNYKHQPVVHERIYKHFGNADAVLSAILA